MQKAQKSQAKAAQKAQKKVVKAPKRALHTQQKKKAVQKKPVQQQQQLSIATATKKAPVLNARFTNDLSQWKAEQAASPELSTLTQAQRSLKIRSLQVAWTKNWLCRRGLYYEDVFEENPDMRLAINMLPSDVRKDRVRRMIRSCDLDSKMVWLPDEMQNYDPMRSYGLDDAIIRVDLWTHSHDNYV